MISGKEEASDYEMQTSNQSLVLQNFWSEFHRKKKLEVVALTIVGQFVVSFKIMFLVLQYQDRRLRSSFKKEIPFPN